MWDRAASLIQKAGARRRAASLRPHPRRRIDGGGACGAGHTPRRAAAKAKARMRGREAASTCGRGSRPRAPPSTGARLGPRDAQRPATAIAGHVSVGARAGRENARQEGRRGAAGPDVEEPLRAPCRNAGQQGRDGVAERPADPALEARRVLQRSHRVASHRGWAWRRASAERGGAGATGIRKLAGGWGLAAGVGRELDGEGGPRRARASHSGAWRRRKEEARVPYAQVFARQRGWGIY